MIHKTRSKSSVLERACVAPQNNVRNTTMQTTDDYNSFWAMLFAKATGQLSPNEIPVTALKQDAH